MWVFCAISLTPLFKVVAKSQFVCVLLLVVPWEQQNKTLEAVTKLLPSCCLPTALSSFLKGPKDVPCATRAGAEAPQPRRAVGAALCSALLALLSSVDSHLPIQHPSRRGREEPEGFVSEPPLPRAATAC